MRCRVYVRVSTDDQRDNGYSIDLQLRMIKEYCEKNDYDIADIYNDASHSGKDFLMFKLNLYSLINSTMGIPIPLKVKLILKKRQ